MGAPQVPRNIPRGLGLGRRWGFSGCLRGQGGGQDTDVGTDEG